jgi:hypothetical protein
MKMFRLLLTLVAMAMVSGAYAQEEAKASFKLSGMFRTLGEYRDGFGKPLVKDVSVPASVIRARTRFTAEYTKDKLTTKLTIQDTRSWGSQYITANDVSEPLHVFEAWAKYQFTPKLALKLGRQQITYGFNRLLDNVDFSNQGLSHDAAVLQYETPENTKLHFGFSKSSATKFSSAGEAYTNSGYHKHMAFMFYSNKLSENVTLNILDLFLTYQGETSPENVRGLNTLGGNLIYDSEGLFADLTSYYQHASRGALNTNKVSAYMVAAGVGMKFGKSSLKLCYDLYSGKDVGSNENTTFDKLYGGGHRYLGHMDYFTTIPEQGINDLYLEFKTTINDKSSLLANLHYLSSTNAITNYSSALGTELDMAYSYKAAKEAEFKFGYSFMLPTETYKAVWLKDNNADTRFANWFWVMATFTPTFLNM